MGIAEDKQEAMRRGRHLFSGSLNRDWAEVPADVSPSRFIPVDRNPDGSTLGMDLDSGRFFVFRPASEFYEARYTELVPEVGPSPARPSSVDRGTRRRDRSTEGEGSQQHQGPRNQARQARPRRRARQAEPTHLCQPDWWCRQIQPYTNTAMQPATKIVAGHRFSECSFSSSYLSPIAILCPGRKSFLPDSYCSATPIAYGRCAPLVFEDFFVA